MVSFLLLLPLLNSSWRSLNPFMVESTTPQAGQVVCSSRALNLWNGTRKRQAQRSAFSGREKTAETIRLCKMNLAVHGLSGDIKQGNTYYEDIHNSIRKFDFVMANPPFNVNGVDKEKLRGDKRFPFGLPKPDNANYLWIQIFLSALDERAAGLDL